MKRASILLSVVSFFVCVGAADEASEIFGRFLHVKGTVEIKKKDSTHRISAKRGDLIRYGDKVWTGPNSRATVITATRKVVNLEADSQLDTTGEEPRGWLAETLIMEGLFERPETTGALVAVAGVRAPLEYVLSPRNSAVKSTTPQIRLRELPPDHLYRIKITGGGLPAPYQGTIDTNVLDLSKLDLRRPLERERTYFIQVELIEQGGGLRGKERDIYIYPLGTEDVAKITEIEREIEKLEKADPGNPSYKILLASQYEDMRLYSDALAIYESLYARQPTDEFIRSQLAHLYNQTKLITELRKLSQPEQ